MHFKVCTDVPIKMYVPGDVAASIKRRGFLLQRHLIEWCRKFRLLLITRYDFICQEHSILWASLAARPSLERRKIRGCGKNSLIIFRVNLSNPQCVNLKQRNLQGAHVETYSRIQLISVVKLIFQFPYLQVDAHPDSTFRRCVRNVQDLTAAISVLIINIATGNAGLIISWSLGRRLGTCNDKRGWIVKTLSHF